MREPNSVYEMFAKAVAHDGRLPFLAYAPCEARAFEPAGAEFSYADAAAQVSQLADAYRGAGYQPGHRVALVLGNRPQYFWHFLALNQLGVCAVPVNPDLLAHEFAHAFALADVGLVVTTPDLAGVVNAAAQDVPVPPALAMLNDTSLPPPSRAPLPDAANVMQRGALIIFTSGTTSRPKGCLISNQSCLASGRSYTDIGGLLTLEEGKERLYMPLPVFHMNATVLALNAMLRTRGCFITTDQFRASTWWDEINAARATCLHYLGLIPPILLKTPVVAGEGAPTVKFGLGAGVDPVLHAPFEDRFGFPLVEIWGMTETSRIIGNAAEPRRTDTRAFGVPHAPWEVKVVDDDGREVPPGVPGAFLVRCVGEDPKAGFFSEYIKNPEETTKAWEGGWFHTGDVVTQDEDGMLYFVERRKNIIRRSGENIAAAEVEEALIGNPDVARVVVLAVPDKLREEEPLACVVLANPEEASAAKAEEIYRFGADRLARHKRPAWVQFITDVPVTPTQKVRKDVLLDGFAVDGPLTYDLRDLKNQK
ncbi:MAG: AMP-binding protein [Pseudomonadota bacterium]